MSVEAKYLLRDLEERDLDQVIAIERDVFTSPWSRQAFVEAMNNGALNSVLEIEGTIAAYAVNVVVLDEFHILNIAVKAEYRRIGLAGRLLDHSLEQARKRGSTDVFLEVRVTNDPAIKLYEKFGFSNLMRRKKYYPDGEDAFVMHLKLSTHRSHSVPATKRKSAHGH